MSSQQQRIVSALAVLMCLAIAPAGEAAKNRWSSQGPFGGSVKALVVDPNDSQTVYAGIDGAGVFRTTDGGITWAEVGGDVADPFPDELDRVQGDRVTGFVGLIELGPPHAAVARTRVVIVGRPRPDRAR